MLGLDQSREGGGNEPDHDPDTTLTNIAARIWLKAPDLLESMHAEVLVMKPRSFTHFKSKEPGPKTFSPPSEATLSALEAELDAWFDAQ